MNNSSETREAWHPQNKHECEAILRELHEILASPHFCNSKRYPALLQYLVENTLAGKSELLKERTIGVEVFGRPPIYDTSADTVVRYTAGEVRKRLLLYYSESERSSNVRISLPAGSYIPEFHHAHNHPGESGDEAGSRAAHHAEGDDHSNQETGAPEVEAASSLAAAKGSFLPDKRTGATPDPALTRTSVFKKPRLWLSVAAMMAILAVAGLLWKYRAVPPQTAVDRFWEPVLRDQRTVMICTGSVVFAQNNFSGVHTAVRDNDYPFVSMQSAAAIAQISGLLERFGASPKLVASASIPLTELSEHSIILIGGYNNQWTLRLLQPLRFHFSPASIDSPDQAASITDQMHSESHLARDHSLPYSSADDYALVARFRNTTTDGWVVALAGLGRNGTEAAAQFATSPHYMQLLREQMGGDFSNHNVEAVLKVNVVDGKTGAPSILAVHVW
jgi:hypothetical protein